MGNVILMVGCIILGLSLYTVMGAFTWNVYLFVTMYLEKDKRYVELVNSNQKVEDNQVVFLFLWPFWWLWVFIAVPFYIAFKLGSKACWCIGKWMGIQYVDSWCRKNNEVKNRFFKEEDEKPLYDLDLDNVKKGG